MSYCKLYIDTKHNKDEAKSIINDAISKAIKDFTALKQSNLLYDIPCIEAHIYKNENHEPHIKIGKKLCCTTVKFYVELGDQYYDDCDDTEDFICVVVEMIKLLRDKLEYVVASCNFEDIITKETDWN